MLKGAPSILKASSLSLGTSSTSASDLAMLSTSIHSNATTLTAASSHSGVRDALCEKKQKILLRFAEKKQRSGHNPRKERMCKIEQLASLGKWEDVKDYATRCSDKETARSSSSRLPFSNSKACQSLRNNDTNLHMICRYHPPLEVVQFFVNGGRNAGSGSLLAAQMNAQGHTPLHVAAQCGASRQVVEFLQSKCTQAVEAQDHEGNTPLHLHILHTTGVKTCDAGIQITQRSKESGKLARNGGFNEDLPAIKTNWTPRGNQVSSLPANCVLVEGPNLDVVEFLMEKASSPEMLLIENVDEVSSVELAIMYELPYNLVARMQKLTRQHRTRLLRRQFETASVNESDRDGDIFLHRGVSSHLALD